MADSFLGRTEPTTPDSKIDTQEVVVGANTVQRERVLISDSVSDSPISVGVEGSSGGSNNAMKVVLSPQAGSANVAKVTMTTTSAVIVGLNANRKSVILKNVGTQTVYVGTSLATLNHFMLDAGESLTLENYTGQLAGITSTGTSEIRYFETTN